MVENIFIITLTVTKFAPQFVLRKYLLMEPFIFVATDAVFEPAYIHGPILKTGLPDGIFSDQKFQFG
jgi:hypothetical protein